MTIFKISFRGVVPCFGLGCLGLLWLAVPWLALPWLALACLGLLSCALAWVGLPWLPWARTRTHTHTSQPKLPLELLFYTFFKYFLGKKYVLKNFHLVTF